MPQGVLPGWIVPTTHRATFSRGVIDNFSMGAAMGAMGLGFKTCLPGGSGSAGGASSSKVACLVDQAPEGRARVEILILCMEQREGGVKPLTPPHSLQTDRWDGSPRLSRRKRVTSDENSRSRSPSSPLAW